MINIKSVVLSLIILLFPISVCSDSWKEWLKEDLYQEQFLEQTEDIIIDAPYRAVDGSNVPITITAVSQDIVKLTLIICLLYTSPSPRDLSTSRMPSSA